MFQFLVDFLVECSAFLVVIFQEFCGRQHFLFFLGELALIKVAVHFHEFFGGELAGLFAHDFAVVVGFEDFFAVVPPVHYGLAVFQAHGLRLAEVLVAFGHVEAVEPGFLGAEPCRRAFRLFVVEEQDVRRDAGVGAKDAARQANDGVQVEFAEQLLLDGEFCAVGTEQESVGDNYARTTHLFEAIHDEHNEKVGGFAALHARREVQLGVHAGAAAIGRVHADAIHLVAVLEFRHLATERIRMGDVRFLDVVDEHVGYR